MEIKTITLIRHGKPELSKKFSNMTIISGSQVQHFIEEYNSCDVSITEKNDHLLHYISNGNLFFSSNTKRAKVSFEKLGVYNYNTTDLLNEAELPYGILNRVKMPLVICLVFLRVTWYLGITKNCESLSDFRKRINCAVHFIESYLHCVNNIVIMAHGFTNMNLYREFRKKGWKKTETVHLNRYLSCISMSK
jgi:broad specificity phosphatase PhoE